MINEKYVSYEDFGAVGDGSADDMPAIVKAHEYANEQGLPVKARAGATYYIGKEPLTARITTDTDFTGAEFVIDDTELEIVNKHVFHIDTDFPTYTPEISYVPKNAKHLDFPHEGRTYVRVYTKDKRIFRRKGENASNGVDASDCFVVDAYGNVENKINYEYTNISQIYARCIDDAPITVKGGKFTTIANRHERVYRYHSRAIKVTRSNVTLTDMRHYVIGEGENGAPYAGFFSLTEAVDVTIKDCLLTPHKTYLTKDSREGYINRMGTYELDFNASIGIRLIRVTQTRNIADTRYWGLIGSNFCKEIYIEDCEMSRFDAHMGVTDTTIKRTKLGHQCLSLIGYGDFYIEDSYVIGYAFVALRGDYGSVWEGNITIKNCEWQPICKGDMNIISAFNDGTHDFGYVSVMPENIVIDGLRVMDGDRDAEAKLYILPVYDANYVPDRPYPYVPVKKLSAKGITSDTARTVNVCKCPELYPETVFDVK